MDWEGRRSDGHNRVKNLKSRLKGESIQLHVYDSLYFQALAFSQVPSGIALIE